MLEILGGGRGAESDTVSAIMSWSLRHTDNNQVTNLKHLFSDGVK